MSGIIVLILVLVAAGALVLWGLFGEKYHWSLIELVDDILEYPNTDAKKSPSNQQSGRKAQSAPRPQQSARRAQYPARRQQPVMTAQNRPRTQGGARAAQGCAKVQQPRKKDNSRFNLPSAY